MDLKELSLSVQKGSVKNVKEYVTQALAENINAETILNEGLISAMTEIGIKFKNNEIFVPEMLIAARAMYAGLSILEPVLIEQGVKSIGCAVIGTVQGDLHDIGKNLVRMMMKGTGINVIDLGVDVSPQKFVDAALENNADIICMSALLTTTMPSMKLVIDELNARNIRNSFKVMIGGAPVNDDYRKEIGADYYTPDAATAAEVAKSILA